MSPQPRNNDVGEHDDDRLTTRAGGRAWLIIIRGSHCVLDE